jgi:hypothetical protein
MLGFRSGSLHAGKQRERERPDALFALEHVLR